MHHSWCDRYIVDIPFLLIIELACQEHVQIRESTNVFFFLQTLMARNDSLWISQQRRSLLENPWHAQWLHERVLNPRSENYVCWQCRWRGMLFPPWILSSSWNRCSHAIPACSRRRPSECFVWFSDCLHKLQLVRLKLPTSWSTPPAVDQGISKTRLALRTDFMEAKHFL